MATFTGQDGLIEVGGTALAEVTSFTIEHTVNTIESTSMGNDYRTYQTGMNEWSGSADILFDGNLVSTFGSDVIGNTAGDSAIVAYPGGNTSGLPKLEGNVIITGFSVSSEMEGMVTASISFQGNGVLSMTDVA